MITLLVASIALGRTTYYNGHDFEVFWRTAQAWLGGQDPYSLNHPRGMVFKYPPWTLPLFAPLALLPLPAAKVLWALLTAASLGASGLWLRRRARADWPAIVGVGIAFWGLWAVHALDGQIALPMLAAALWLWTPELPSAWRTVALAWVLSFKIFTVLPLFHYRLDRRGWATIGASGAFFVLVSSPKLGSWIAAAGSGGELLGEEHVRGAFNPSFTATILSWSGIPANTAYADVALAAILAAALGLAWARASRGLEPAERWSGWLALVPAIHPLPWWHLFVFAFPLAALSIDRASTGGGRGARSLAVIGVFLIAAATRKFLGAFGLAALGGFFELSAAKSFGIVACAAALVLTKQARRLGNSKS
ncbi:MAG TPA: glycosyltransferase 87 family protein [Bdellovibrionota bacterium]|nr:glycosyltransferase 87 family protein [Bdellovibrionota bacterium]